MTILFTCLDSLFPADVTLLPVFEPDFVSELDGQTNPFLACFILSAETEVDIPAFSNFMPGTALRM